MRDERLVDLQLGHGQLPEVGQRRVAGAEVVDRQPHAQVLQAVEHGHRSLRPAHDGRLGELERQGRGGHAGGGDGRADVLDEVAVEEVPGGQVDGDGEIHAGVSPGPALRQRVAHDVGGERLDHAGVLGGGDELVGAERSRAAGGSSARVPRRRRPRHRRATPWAARRRRPRRARVPLAGRRRGPGGEVRTDRTRRRRPRCRSRRAERCRWRHRPAAGAGRRCAACSGYSAMPRLAPSTSETASAVNGESNSAWIVSASFITRRCRATPGHAGRRTGHR